MRPNDWNCITHQTLRKDALEAYLAGGLKEASIVMQVTTETLLNCIGSQTLLQLEYSYITSLSFVLCLTNLIVGYQRKERHACFRRPLRWRWNLRCCRICFRPGHKRQMGLIILQTLPISLYFLTFLPIFTTTHLITNCILSPPT